MFNSKLTAMKKLISLIILTLFTINVLAQQKCKDAVHPTEQRKSILDCCIKEIKNGNVVVYSKNDISFETEAVAVNFNGQLTYLNEHNISIINKMLQNKYEGLYQGHDYKYYQNIYKKANSQMIIGLTIGIVGVGLLTGGIIHMNNYENEYLFDWDGTGAGITTAGAIMIGVGTSLAIVGGAKKHKSKGAMLEIERNAKLTIGMTNNGVGLVLNF
jgi:hypothetical protein